MLIRRLERVRNDKYNIAELSSSALETIFPTFARTCFKGYQTSLSAFSAWLSMEPAESTFDDDHHDNGVLFNFALRCGELPTVCYIWLDPIYFL